RIVAVLRGTACRAAAPTRRATVAPLRIVGPARNTAQRAAGGGGRFDVRETSPFVGARLRCVVLAVGFSPLQLRRDSSVPRRGRRSEIMGKKLYVGNLSFHTTSADLEALFATVGTCESASVVTDRETGRSRGFGFVEMGSNDEAQKAIAALNGRDVQGRQLNVSEARERSDRGGGRGFSGRRSY